MPFAQQFSAVITKGKIIGREISPRSRILNILKSRTVAEQTVRHFHLNPSMSVEKSAIKLRKKIEISNPTPSSKISISCKSTDPKLAADIANYYPVAVRDYIIKNNISLARRSRVTLEKRMDKAKAEFEAAQKSFGQSGDKHFSDIKALSDTYLLLRQQYEISKIEEIKDPLSFQILDPALVPKHPIGPKRGRNIILGVLAGLCLGIGIAFLREYLDDTIHDTDTIEKTVGLPILADPVVVKDTDGISNPITEEDRLFAKNFQLMLKSLPNHQRPRTTDQGLRTKHYKPQTTNILFTSVDNNEVKSLLMYRLARALAEEQKSILIIDCDSGDKNILKTLGKDFKLGGIKLVSVDKMDSIELKDLIPNSDPKYNYIFINTVSGVISSRMLELAIQANLILTTVTLGRTSSLALKEHKVNLEKANPQIWALPSEKRD